MTHFLPHAQNAFMTPQRDWSSCLKKIGEHRDRQAFADLFAHFSPLLNAFLLRGGNLSEANAEELVQDTMIKVWQKAPGFNADTASASTWIYTIARNTRIDWLRQQHRQSANLLQADDIYVDSEMESPDSTLVQLRQEKKIREQLLSLPPEQTEVLSMMYFQGLSGQQVADITQLPLGTVKSRIRLALAKLKIGMTSVTEARYTHD